VDLRGVFAVPAREQALGSASTVAERHRNQYQRNALHDFAVVGHRIQSLVLGNLR
jgi:hypothetical protein